MEQRGAAGQRLTTLGLSLHVQVRTRDSQALPASPLIFKTRKDHYDDPV